MHTGSCLCGGIEYRLDVEPQQIQICHCQQCRKAQGTPFATNAPVPSAAFHIVRGSELLSEFESSPGKWRAFCRRCGSPIYSRRDSMPEVVRVRAGTINEPLRARPVAHFHVASKCNWWDIADGLPQHDAVPAPADGKP